MATKTITAKHMIVRDACRKNHGDTLAGLLALKEIERALFEYLSHSRNEVGGGIQFHLKLEIEREVG